MDNPCDAPVSSESALTTPPAFRRGFASLCLGLVGAPLGAVLCSVGYLIAVLLLESVFVPPLRSPENYGQFGFLLILFGFFGLFYGASFALIPYTRFLLWLPVFLLISVFVCSGDVASFFDATEVTFTAIIVIGVLIVLFAFTTSAVIRHLERRPRHVD